VLTNFRGLDGPEFFADPIDCTLVEAIARIYEITVRNARSQLINGNFLFDFRTSTLSIDPTAFLGKVLADFVPHGSQ